LVCGEKGLIAAEVAASRVMILLRIDKSWFRKG
jgi:hypothetical protein